VARLEATGLDLLEAHCERTPTLFIQQTADFNGQFAALADGVAGRHTRYVEVPGGGHLYSDLPPLVDAIEAWLT
jgi:hypothetical protein